MTFSRGHQAPAQPGVSSDELVAARPPLPGVAARAAGLLGWVSDKLDRLTVFLAAALTAAMATALLLQVLFRFVLRSPLSWSEEFARYCFVWLASLGAAAGVRRGLHPGLDLMVADRFGRVREAAAWIGAGCSGLLLAVLAVYGWRLAAFNMRQLSPAMGLPMGVPYAAVPVGAVVMLVHLVARLVEPSRGQPGTQ